MVSRRDIAVFAGELVRRRVFRVALGYGALAWFVIQFSATVLPILGIREDYQRVVLVMVAIGAPIALVLAWIFDITPEGLQRTEPRHPAAERAGRVATDPGRSLIVLPFAELSGQPGNEYFSDGVTEDIIAALSGLREIRVISRTSAMQYRNTTKSLPEIAAEVDVAHVLEGSVRRAGSRIRIVAQLIDARTDEHIWAETYDRDAEDIFGIQKDVAERIAEALRAGLTAAGRARITEPPTERLDAYDAYLRGRHAWNQRTETSIRAAIEHLLQATRIDPAFALAWAGLAEAHVTLALYGAAPPAELMPAARECAERALALRPRLAEALTPLAAVRLHYDWDWAGAEAGYRQATAAAPQYPTAHHWYANFLTAAGRFDEARAALEHARLLDPLSPAILSTAGIISYFERDWRRAAAELESALAKHPGFPLAGMFLGLVHTAAGEHERAVTRLEQAVELSAGSVECRGALAAALGRSGNVQRAHTLLEGLRSEPYVSPIQLAFVHAALGETGAALEQLTAAVQLRAAHLVTAAVRPLLDPVRAAPEFTRILEPVFRSRPHAPRPTPA